MNDKLIVTYRALQQMTDRFEILSAVKAGKVKAAEAAFTLGLSYRQVLRLKQRVAQHGAHGLLRPVPPRSSRRLPPEMRQTIADLYDARCRGFNVRHFGEMLQREFDIRISYETLRQILIRAGHHQVRHRQPVYRRRRRMPYAGMLLQMDTSKHRWLNHVNEEWALIAVLDDASNEVLAAGFYPHDTTYANMAILRQVVERKGLFMALYADKASHFYTTRRGGTHYQVAQEQEETQIERALRELGIKYIPANSPQAKGRIERLWRLFQDRLIHEMQFYHIRDYREADKFLRQVFVPRYNRDFTHAVQALYKPLPPGIRLELVFCRKEERLVKNDNTIQYAGQTIQLPPSRYRLTFARTKVMVADSGTGRLWILFERQVITEVKLNPRAQERLGKLSAAENYLQQRRYITSERPRPSKQLRLNSKPAGANVTFSRSNYVTS